MNVYYLKIQFISKYFLQLVKYSRKFCFFRFVVLLETIGITTNERTNKILHDCV